MIAFFGMILLCGIILIAVGIYQKKTCYDRPHFQNARITGYVKYENNARGLSFAAVELISSAAGMKHPVVDVMLDDGSVRSVRLNIAVNDQIIGNSPELGLDGEVQVLFFGSNPKIAYLQNHPMAQTVLRVSAPLIIGIAVTALGILLIGADIYYTLTLK